MVTPKAYGKALKVSELPEGIRRFFPSRSSASSGECKSNPGLSPEYLLPIIRGILDDIYQIRDALETLEMRMIASSFLVVYEGDEEAVREAAGDIQAEKSNPAAKSASNEGDSDDSCSSSEPNPVYAVKLIDFAHTRFVPGEGPDQRLLKGVDTVIQLFEARAKEVEEELDEGD